MAKPNKTPTPPPQPEAPKRLEPSEFIGFGVAKLASTEMRGWAAVRIRTNAEGQSAVEILTPERNEVYEDKFRALARARNGFIEQFARPEPRKLNYDR